MRKGNGRENRQRDPRQIDYRSETRQGAVDRVIGDAFLGGMAHRRNVFPAGLSRGEVSLEVRQRVQLCRLLGEYQRGSYEQVAQSTGHVTSQSGRT